MFSLGTFSFLWLAVHKAAAAFQLPPPRLATIGTCLSNCTCNTIFAWWTILWFGVTFFILQTSCIEKLKRQKTICAKMEHFNCSNCQIACARLRKLFLRSPRQSIPMAYILNYSSISKSSFRCLSSSYVSWDFGCLALYNDRWGFTVRASPAVLSIWSCTVKLDSGKWFWLSVIAECLVASKGRSNLHTWRKECTKYDFTAAQCFWLAHYNDWSKWFAIGSPPSIWYPSISL